jgi:NADPH:quinone reductase
MRVVRVTRFGGPDVLVPGEAPDPVAGPGQVVVEVAVASVTFVETQIRRGLDRWHARPPVPYVPGGLVAGLVSSADPAWSRRRVIASTGATGGFAERAVAAVEDLFPVPDGLGLPEATALHSDGSTAQGLVETAGVRAGEWVLVEAAAGGVDVVFDGVGEEIGRVAFDVTADGGRFSMHGASSGEPTIIDPAAARRKNVDLTTAYSNTNDEFRALLVGIGRPFVQKISQPN